MKNQHLIAALFVSLAGAFALGYWVSRASAAGIPASPTMTYSGILTDTAGTLLAAPPLPLVQQPGRGPPARELDHLDGAGQLVHDRGGPASGTGDCARRVRASEPPRSPCAYSAFDFFGILAFRLPGLLSRRCLRRSDISVHRQVGSAVRGPPSRCAIHGSHSARPGRNRRRVRSRTRPWVVERTAGDPGRTARFHEPRGPGRQGWPSGNPRRPASRSTPGFPRRPWPPPWRRPLQERRSRCR